jgi:hypothetical protein
MTRSVRVGSAVEDDIARQLESDAAALFWRHDLAAALTLLAREGTWESLPNHGGGRRLTVEGLTIGAFHIFATDDELDPRPGALVVYAVDIWPDGFPDDYTFDRSPAEALVASPLLGCQQPSTEMLKVKISCVGEGSHRRIRDATHNPSD